MSQRYALFHGAPASRRRMWHLGVLQFAAAGLCLIATPALGQIWGTRWNTPGPANAVLAPPQGGTKSITALWPPEWP